jgi:hypothetical protein
MNTLARLAPAWMLAAAVTLAAPAHALGGWVAAAASDMDQRASYSGGDDVASATQRTMEYCRNIHPDCVFVIVGTPCVSVAGTNHHFYGGTGNSKEAALQAAFAQAGSGASDYGVACLWDVRT